MKSEKGKQLTRSRPRELAQFVPRASCTGSGADRLQPRVILHPTDYSKTSRQALQLACRIARDSGSRLVVMHVAEPVQVSSLGMAPVFPLPKGYRGAWESRLRLMQPSDPTLQVEHRLEVGDIAAAILRVAREVQSDLIVMACRERTWLGKLMARSVTEEVERKAPCPVLRLNTRLPGNGVEMVGGDSRENDEIQPRAILHPTDFSQQALYGFEVARSLARESGSELIVAHVAPVPELHKKRSYRDEIEAALRRMTGSDPTVRAHRGLLADDPAAEILRMVRESWCDLIVMGTRGRTGLGRLFARSVAAEVRRKSHCPVVTVKVPPDYATTRNRQLPCATPKTSHTDLDGEDHDFGSPHPACDGLLALR